MDLAGSVVVVVGAMIRREERVQKKPLTKFHGNLYI